MIFSIFSPHTICTKYFYLAAILLLGFDLGEQDCGSPAVGPALAAVPRVGIQVAHLATWSNTVDIMGGNRAS